MDGGRADEGRQERWMNARRTLQDAVRTLTGRYMNGRTTPGTMDCTWTQSRQRKEDIFATFFETFSSDLLRNTFSRTELDKKVVV